VEIYQANSIGKIAFENLSKNSFGEVSGITSRGIFLKMDDNSIVFISNTDFHNPLTINLDSELTNPSAIVKEKVFISGTEIYFIESSLVIHHASAKVWSSQNNTRKITNFPSLNAVRSFLLTLHSSLTQPNLYLDAVLDLLDTSIPQDNSTEILSFLRGLVEGIDHSPEHCLPSFRYLVGRGRGLTPSGDDILLGWIYALTRLAGHTTLQISPLHNLLAASLENNTTSISINLIKAAMLEEIDERLLRAFECMVFDQSPTPAIITSILEWGSSSGVEVCAGMGLGIVSLSQYRR